MGREPKVMAAAGMKGCGKSVKTIQLLDEIVRGNAAKGIAPRKALILDANDEFSDFWFFNNPHRKIPAIAIRDLPRFTMSNIPELRRIRPFFDDGRKMSLDDIAATLTHILDVYRQGALLVEDPTKYISDTIKGDLIGALATCRHLGIDLILHFQSVGKLAQPKLFGNTSWVRLHKTADSVARHANKFQDKEELFQIAENIVNYKTDVEKNKRFYLLIDNEGSKILEGEYKISRDDVENAIETYITDNRTRLIKPLLSKVDLNSGKKLYNEVTAIKYKRNQLLLKYFGK